MDSITTHDHIEEYRRQLSVIAFTQIQTYPVGMKLMKPVPIDLVSMLADDYEPTPNVPNHDEWRMGFFNDKNSYCRRYAMDVTDTVTGITVRSRFAVSDMAQDLSESLITLQEIEDRLLETAIRQLDNERTKCLTTA